MGKRSGLVVGGGIAGLTYAVAARRAGHDVEVIEVRPGWAVAGWGLSLTGPAVRALRTLGLDGACVEAGYPIFRTRHCDAAGEVRATMELPSVLGPGRPAEVGIGRPALHRILRERAERAGATLRTGLSVVDLPPDGPVRLSDGSTRTVDYVVGADGVRSSTRSRLGLTGEPRYTGQMVWRALVDRPAWATEIHTFAGPTGTTGLIPISATSAYIFLTESTDPTAEPPAVADELLAVRMRELLAPFSGRFAEVRDTIQNPAQVVRRPVHTLFVDAPWHTGRAVLIGDAAHSPSPQMVSGAALAIEDAVVLADELTAPADPPGFTAVSNSANAANSANADGSADLDGSANASDSANVDGSADLADSADLESAFAAYYRRRRDRARALVDTSVEIGRRERQGRHHEVHALMHQGHAAMAAPI